VKKKKEKKIRTTNSRALVEIYNAIDVLLDFSSKSMAVPERDPAINAF